MNMKTLNIDLFALAEPKGRGDCLSLAREILAEIESIESHIDSAIAKCEAASLVAA